MLTADGHAVTFSMNVGYTIQNALKMRTKVQDFDPTLERAARGHAAQVVNGSDLASLKEDIGLIVEETLKSLQGQTKEWGVKIKSVKLTDFVPAKQYRWFGGIQ
jgi:regulator of protease activity HflC (stomatin/prohibitin superfamily)